MTWILIIILNGSAVETTEFYTFEACRHAATVVEDTHWRTTAICVEKGVTQ
jgi:hypothetical protein